MRYSDRYSPACRTADTLPVGYVLLIVAGVLATIYDVWGWVAG